MCLARLKTRRASVSSSVTKGRQKKKGGGRWVPLLNEMGDQVTQKMEKAEILNTFFALIFTNKSGNKRGIPGSRQRPGGNVEQGLFFLERRSKQGILK